jgi:hypothetical protein
VSPPIAEYKLSDLLSSAGATIGIIIGGTIFLQFLSTKYTELSGRLREIAAEYRQKADKEPRHGPLQDQVRLYRKRLVLLHWGSSLGAVALLSLLAAVLAGALSMIYPSLRVIKTLGTAALLFGLVLIAAAVALEFVETVMAAKEIVDEVADLDDRAKLHSH